MKKSILFSVFVLLFAFYNTISAQAALTATIAGKSSGEISERQIVGYGLAVDNEEYEVISFDLTYEIEGDDLVTHSVQGNRFQTKEVLPALFKLNDGTKVYFENIKCKKKDSDEVIDLPALTFTLVKTPR